MEWTGQAREYPWAKHVLIEATLIHTNFCPDSKISIYYRRKKDSIGGKKAMVASGSYVGR